MELPLVVADPGLGDGALGVVALAFGGWVVGREDGGGGADDGADLVIHRLGLGLVDQLVGHKGAGAGIARLAALGDDDLGVLVEVVVVLCLGADLGADLAGLGEVDVGVRGGEGGVGRADDGAVAGGGHDGGFGFVGACVFRSGDADDGEVGWVRCRESGGSKGGDVEFAFVW